MRKNMLKAIWPLFAALTITSSALGGDGGLARTPASAFISGSCLSPQPNGAMLLYGNVGCNSSIELDEYFEAAYGANPSGQQTVYWHATKPTGTVFSARLVSYKADGTQWSASGWNSNGGLRSASINVNEGVVVLHAKMRSTTSSPLLFPSLNSILTGIYTN